MLSITSHTLAQVGITCAVYVHPLAPYLIPTSQNMRHFNVVVLGAGGVGKSALTVRFVQDVFVENYDPTIEEAYRRILDIDGVKTSLEVLDTAGAEQFTALKELYIKSGQGFVLVFSLTQEASLRELNNLRQQIHRVKGMDSVSAIDDNRMQQLPLYAGCSYRCRWDKA